MLEEWFSYFYLKEKKAKTPRDKFRYLISHSIVSYTEQVLKEYGEIESGHEGLVYWAGIRHENEIRVNAVIAPETISSEGRVTVMPKSNFEVIQCLSHNKFIHLGQVHSHPGRWVGHSSGDDERASFKRNGLLSIVVANYCHGGMLPLKNCGVHRYTNEQFIRLSMKYVGMHFELSDMKGDLYDFRK